jgi:3-oxoacyl-[acyl-carrier-protein] synthase II
MPLPKTPDDRQPDSPLRVTRQKSMNQELSRRVVVTGIGLISPVGVGTDETWEALLRGQTGIAPITLFDARGLACQIAGEVKGFVSEDFIERKDLKKTGRFIQLTIAATDSAIEDSGLQINSENADRVGVYIGSSCIGGLEVIEREHQKLLKSGPGHVSPFFVTATMVNLAAGQVAIRTGAKGPNLACSTACTTGAHAIGEAFRVIQAGDADVMICGSGEAIVSSLAIAGLGAMRALSARNDAPEKASRPWDRGRDGFVVGEGAAILVLESYEHAVGRQARVLAELVGYARNSDAYHPNAPLENGSGIRKVMELALRDARLNPCDVGYLNAHATSTQLGDRAEAKAIWEVFGEQNPSLLVGSTKSMTGHLVGASGSLEAGLAILAIRDQKVPPNINLEDPDVSSPLNYVSSKATYALMDYAMTNSFGFGGTNASLIFGKPPSNSEFVI